MGGIPFVVEHGWWIAKLLVGVCGVLGMVAFQLWCRLRERSQLGRERIARSRDVGSLGAGISTITGTLRGRAATAYAENGKVICERTTELVLESDGQRVELRGDVQVVGATRTAASRCRIPRGFLAVTERGAWRALEVRDGDPVIATGALTNIASGESADYREHAGRWVMEPRTTVPVIELFAARPRVSPPIVHPVRLALALAVSAGLGYLALWGAGAWLVRGAHRAGHAPLYAIDPSSKLALASALPHVRGEALDELSRRMQRDYARTDDVVETRFRLAELIGGCRARAALELAEQHFGEALVTAHACGDREHEVDALIYLGRYKSALRVGPVTPEQRALTAIVTGNWGAAAVVADELAHHGHAHTVDARYLCLGDWFREKAGERPRLEHASYAPVTCQIILALHQTGDARLSLLRAARSNPDMSQIAAIDLADDLAWAFGDPEQPLRGDSMPSISVLLGEDRLHRARPWLASGAISLRGDATGWAERAVRDAIHGDTLAADADLRHAEGLDNALEHVDLEGLRIAIGLHSSQPLSAAGRNPLAKLVDLRTGANVPYGGDGAALARSIVEMHPTWETNAGSLLATVPRMQLNTGELALALHGFLDPRATDLRHMPFDLLAEAAIRRDLARMAGDEPYALRWQATIDLQLPVLDDPDRLLALLVWEN
jgi:hypothetical protein